MMMHARPHAPCVLLLLLVLLTGCGAITEEVMVRMVTREVGSVLDLDGEQRRELRDVVGEHMHELRGAQLASLIQLMVQMRAVVWRGADMASLTTLLAGFEELMESVAEVVIPDTAELLTRLRPEQVDRLETSIVQRIEEAYGDLELPEDERRAESEKRLIASFEGFVGELSAVQREALIEVARTFPDEREARRRSDLRRVDRVTEALRGSSEPEVIEGILRGLWAERAEIDGSERDADSRNNDQIRLILALDVTLTEEQRQKAVDDVDRKIRRLERLRSR